MIDFLCSKSEAAGQAAAAEREKEKLLREFRQFYAGNIDIKIAPKQYPMGYSVIGALTVNGETVREYDHIDLLFLDLNELMLKRILETRATEVRP